MIEPFGSEEDEDVVVVVVGGASCVDGLVTAVGQCIDIQPMVSSCQFHLYEQKVASGASHRW